VRDVTITVTHLGPPRESETGPFHSPNAFYTSLELVVLTREHCSKVFSADDPFVFEDSTVEIGD